MGEREESNFNPPDAGTHDFEPLGEEELGERMRLAFNRAKFVEDLEELLASPEFMEQSRLLMAQLRSMSKEEKSERVRLLHHQIWGEEEGEKRFQDLFKNPEKELNWEDWDALDVKHDREQRLKRGITQEYADKKSEGIIDNLEIDTENL